MASGASGDRGPDSFGGAMLTRRQLAQIAMRHDTSMSRAMLRALGLDARRAGATLLRSTGEPPRETGTTSSTSKLIGSPAGSE